MKPLGVHQRSICLTTALAVSLGAALAAASPPIANTNITPEQIAQPSPKACGNPGSPPCPLQAWMRANIALPLAGNNLSALADGLERTARLSPDMSWRSWREIASRGAASARKGDIANTRAACKSCHEAWREAYKEKFRSRPVPR